MALKTWWLIFMDGSTQKIEASDIQAAWIAGKIVAKERGTYLLTVREKL